MNPSTLANITLESLLEKAHIGIVIHDWSTRVIYANPSALKLMRLTYKQMIGRDAQDPDWKLLDETGEVLSVDNYPVNRVKRLRAPIVNQVYGLRPNNDSLITWLNVNAYFESADDTSDGFIVVTFTDISQFKHEFSFQSIVNNTDDVVIVTEASNIEAPLGPKIVYVNKAFEKLTKYKAAEVIGETPRILQGKDTDKKVLKKLKQCLIQKKSCRVQLLNYSKTGHPYWLDMNVFPLKSANGTVTHFASVERDVTSSMFLEQTLKKRNSDLKQIKDSLQQLIEEKTFKLKLANAKLERLAYYDSLTQIPNRRSFIEQAKKQVSSCVRHDHALIVGILDVDHFKQVNDTYGHSFGDKVLQFISQSMVATFRAEDVFGRLGGEEFAFAMVVEHSSDTIEIARRLCKDIASKPLVIDGVELKITVSIGVSVVKPSERLSLDQALDEADKCLYKAKKLGRNQVQVAYYNK